MGGVSQNQEYHFVIKIVIVLGLCWGSVFGKLPFREYLPKPPAKFPCFVLYIYIYIY